MNLVYECGVRGVCSCVPVRVCMCVRACQSTCVCVWMRAVNTVVACVHVVTLIFLLTFGL